MYLLSVILLLFVLPTGFVLGEKLLFASALGWMPLIGKWFVFWAVGVRLLLAGLTQVSRPEFTAKRIFEIEDSSVWPIVREVGFGNISMAVLGLASLWNASWVVPAALVGGLYYGLAGLVHVARGGGNPKEQTAMVTDLAMFLVLAAFVIWSLA
jgi:hypothetical protein